MARTVATSLLVAIAYVVGAKCGFAVAFATKQVTAVWPPTGIALAALLIWGYRVWPGVWIGAFVSNAMSAEPAWAAATIATGNTVAPLVAAIFLKRAGGFEPALERVRDVLALALTAVFVMTVSASNGVTTLAFAHIVDWNHFAGVWWVWWAGDTMGVLIVTPLILTLFRTPKIKLPDSGDALELAVLAVALITVTWISFLSDAPLRFSVYPFVIWIALRFRQRETSTAVAVVCAVAVWAAAHGVGPWTTGSLDSRILQLDSWVSILAFTSLILGAITAERRAARVDLQALLDQAKSSAETLQAAFVPERLPQRLGLQCDVIYIAAEREALIGGDWYDAFDLPDGRIVFSIGDVTGHGLEAAVVAARLRQSIFAAAFQTDDPAEILATADRAMRARAEAPATAVVAILSADLATMSYASAGHPPPIVAGPHLPARSLAYGGLPFGIGMPVASQTHHIALERDAAVLFYTDGLTEFNRNIEGAESAVFQAMTRLAEGARIDRPAAFVQQSVMGDEPPLDDTVLLVAQLCVALRKSWNYDSRSSHDAHVLRRDIARFMRYFAPADGDLFRAELIIGEVLANTVEHAPGTVHVEIDWTDLHPVITVRDGGPGLTHLAEMLPADPLSETGRGLFLIASLAVDVRVESVPGGGTSMRIVLPITRSAQLPR